MNNSSIYKIFTMLSERECKKEEILELLKIKPPTFYKSIQKLKSAGFKIKKKNNYYYLEKYRKILSFDNCEKSVIAYMLNIALKYLPQYKYGYFKNLIQKYIFLAREADYNEIIKKFQLLKKYSLIEEYKEKIKELEVFIIKKETAKITINSNKVLRIRPLRFDWKKEKIFLCYMNMAKDEEEKLNIENIVKIEKNTQKDFINGENEIIFELYGALAKRYLLKKDERVVKNKKDSLVIATKTNDKAALFRRLLRYDTLCKILFPKYEVNNFNKLIDEAIMNIELFKGENE